MGAASSIVTRTNRTAITETIGLGRSVAQGGREDRAGGPYYGVRLHVALYCVLDMIPDLICVSLTPLNVFACLCLYTCSPRMLGGAPTEHLCQVWYIFLLM